MQQVLPSVIIGLEEALGIESGSWDGQGKRTTLTTTQQAMCDLWDKHTWSEFEAHSVEETIENWDRASVMVEVGLIDAEKLPLSGVESARRILDTPPCPPTS